MRVNRGLFNQKLSAQFLEMVPLKPGVYLFFNDARNPIYVGKAKLLKRRLQQYRNAKRCKKHHKMRAILREAAEVEYFECVSHLEALLLENRLIQKLRPKFNVAGAFSFLYPMIGLKRDGLTLALAYTTVPATYIEFEMYGAYRSRLIAREAFEALVECLAFVAHPEPYKALKQFPRARFSKLAAFRQLQDHWYKSLQEFLRGDSSAFLESLVLALLEKPTARRRAEEIQNHVDALKRFFRHEAKKLRQALKRNGCPNIRSISQTERDRLFLQATYRDDSPPLNHAES